MTSQNSMNSRLFPFPVFRICLPFLLMIPAISLASPAYAYDDYEWFLNCKDPDSLNCESITPFPLWRFNETVKNCGYPGELMKLNCEGDRATIQMLGAKYKLLGFNFTFSITDQILIIAEIDSSVSDPFCSPKQQHTPSNSILAIIPVYNSDCSQPTCSAPYCPFSILVPISPSLLEELGADDWQNVAHQILAKFNNSARNLLVGQACTNCSVSADYCGYDLELNQTKCYCQSSSNGFEDCPSSPYAEAPTKAQLPKTEPAASDNTKKPKKTTPLVIALGVSIGGACLVATILGCCFFYCLRRKKKHPIGSITKEGHSPPVSDPLSNKDISPPPLILNSLYQTHSIPSYPSSKSDLERASTNHDIQVFNYAELEKATDNFNSSRELGDGGFGTVYYGKLVDGRKVAVKRLYEHNCKRVEQFLNEVDILAHLQHKNLVKLYGCTSRFSQGLLLVYEYIPNGTVADHLHGSRANFGLLSWPIRLRIATETANALAYLHRSEIIHRDVKTNNILLDNNFIVKVADFGLSRLFPTDVTHVSTAPQGTPGYVDPEYYQCYQLTTKSDVYSFGVVLIELLSSLRAVDTDRKRHDINLSNMAVSRIQSGALNELIDPKLGFDKNHEVMREITLVAELAFRCLQQERDMRPSMEEVVEVLREIDNDQSSSGMAKVVDIGVVGDDTELTKRSPPSFSPNSVIANNWVNSSSTTNSL